MGKDLYETSDVARDIFDTGSGITDMDIPDVLWGGNFDRMQETSVAQPASTVYLLAKYFDLHEKGFTPDVGEGHSAGEIALLGMSKVTSIQDTIRISKSRAEAMTSAHKSRPGKMAAVKNLSAEQIRQKLEQYITTGRLSLTNFNSATQNVISGDVDLIDKARDLLQATKSLHLAEKIKNGKVRILPIEIAAHSKYHMGPARRPLSKELETVAFNSSDFDIMLNSVRYLSEIGTDSLRNYLVGQLVNQVDFVGGTRRLYDDGIRRFYDPGPRPIMSSLVLEDYEGLVNIVNDEELSSLS